jgi:hypothetical protein
MIPNEIVDRCRKDPPVAEYLSRCLEAYDEAMRRGKLSSFKCDMKEKLLHWYVKFANMTDDSWK